MHDPAKVAKDYPWINSTILSFIYGHEPLDLENDKELEKKLRGANLRHFLKKTRPPYPLYNCGFGHFSCKNYWLLYNYHNYKYNINNT